MMQGGAKNLLLFFNLLCHTYIPCQVSSHHLTLRYSAWPTGSICFAACGSSTVNNLAYLRAAAAVAAATNKSVRHAGPAVPTPPITLPPNPLPSLHTCCRLTFGFIMVPSLGLMGGIAVGVVAATLYFAVEYAKVSSKDMHRINSHCCINTSPALQLY
jgi:hypothetical protein